MTKMCGQQTNRKEIISITSSQKGRKKIKREREWKKKSFACPLNLFFQKGKDFGFVTKREKRKEREKERERERERERDRKREILYRVIVFGWNAFQIGSK